MHCKLALMCLLVFPAHIVIAAADCIDRRSVTNSDYIAVRTCMAARAQKVPFNIFFSSRPILRELVRDRCYRLVRALIVCGVDLDQKSGGCKTTALHCAVLGGDEKMVRILLHAGADINPRTVDGHTPLHWAAAGGCAGMVRLLLDWGAHVSPLSNDLLMPLHWAAIGGHEAVARLLLDRGSYMRHRGKMGASALDLALQGNHISVARLLVTRGAGLHQEGLGTVLMGQLGHKDRALCEEFQQICEVGNRLLQYVDCYANPASRVSTQLIKDLLSTSMGKDVLYFRSFYKNKHGKSPWVRAIDLEFEDAVRMMLGAGADINSIHAYNNITPLHRAVQRGSKRIVRLLLRYGADVNVSASRLGTPLEVVLDKLKGHDCSRKKLENVAKKLICAGAWLPDRSSLFVSERHHLVDDRVKIEQSDRLSSMQTLYTELRLLCIYRIFKKYGLPRNVRMLILQS